MRRVFLEDDAAASFEDAAVAILPVPWEATVSYGAGTRRGPQAILDASEQLELWDERCECAPWRRGIWTDRPLDLDPADQPAALRRIEARVGELLDAGRHVIALGGEHSITPPAVRAAAARHPGLHVVQLDAHADLRDRYQDSPTSHACAMARCLEVAPVRAIGVRAWSEEEAATMRALAPDRYRAVHARELGAEGWIDRALAGLAGRPVYLTFDVDYLDPSIVPATGTPEPGGGAWWPTLDLLDRLYREADVVAADVVELAPIEGLHHADFAVARLVYHLAALAVEGG